MSIADDGSVNFGTTHQSQPQQNPEMQQALSSVWNYKYEPNQLYPELANVMSMQPLDGTISASRKQMYGGSHIQQCLVFNKSMPRRLMTGQEMEYGKATFSTKVERDAVVLAIIPFYNDRTIGVDTIRHNPEDVVVLEYQDNGEIDYVSMKEYFSNHQYFGFKYQNTDKARMMHSKRYPISAGTILQDSPSKRPDGNYCYGANFNVLFATLPETAEDGILISEEIVPWLMTRKYEKRTVSFGSTHFPVNRLGTDEKHKAFPDIGEYISPDGLLMATRSYNESYSPVEMSNAASREVNYIFDKLTYVSPGRGKVIDIRVITDVSRQPNSPTLCNEQSLKYDRAARIFYRAILDLYNSLKNKRDHQTLKISHNFKNLVKHAFSVIQEENNSEEQRVQKIYRAAPMDDITIEFVVEYEILPTNGFKYTDTCGGKGVGVRIMCKEDMPIDARGNRAHVVMDSIATVSRQNLSRLYEQFFNACSRDLVKEFCDSFSVPYPDTLGQKLPLADKMRIQDAFTKQDPVANAIWDRFMHYNEIITPHQAEFYYDVSRKGKRAEHIISIMEDGIYIFHPTNNDPELPDVMDELIKHFMPFIGPVTYKDHSGGYTTTLDPMLIGEVYFIMLEKTGDDYSAVSSGKLQGIGILAHINNQDKYSSPWRQQSIRFWGETETSIGTAYMGDEVMAEIMNRNNSIVAHRYGVYNILRSLSPMRIDTLVDRNEVSINSSKPSEFVKHVALCNGWEMAYSPYMEHEPKPTAINFVV